MGTANRAGTYFGTPLEWTVDDAVSSICFKIQMDLTHFWDGESWVPVNDVQMMGYFYPVGKGGIRNEVCCNMLMTALGWDGESVGSLHRGQFGGIKCQCEVREETYNGKTRLKLKWLNPRDFAPKRLEKVFENQSAGIEMG